MRGARGRVRRVRGRGGASGMRRVPPAPSSFNFFTAAIRFRRDGDDLERCWRERLRTRQPVRSAVCGAPATCAAPASKSKSTGTAPRSASRVARPREH